MKILSTYAILLIFLLFTNISFAYTVVGSYVPIFQYFKVTYSASVNQVIEQDITNFQLGANSNCGQTCIDISLMSTPDSNKGGQVSISILNTNKTPFCNGELILPLSLDAKGNIQTKNTSYPINMDGCKKSLTAIVTGDPDSTTGYTISIQ